MNSKLKVLRMVLVTSTISAVFVFLVHYSISGISKEIASYTENSAQCESLGGKYGSDKCYVDGKEIYLEE